MNTGRVNAVIVSDGADELQALRWVGEHTATRLEAADISVSALRERRVSYADLREAGINPGIAALLRRVHSLPWSHSSDGGDLDRRADQVRGLGDAERAWVTASAGGWEEAAVPTGSDRVLDREPTAEWEDPISPTVVRGIGPKRAAQLAEAGVVSLRALQVADPTALANALGYSVETIRRWQTRAANQQ